MAEATDSYTKRLYTSRPDGPLPCLVRCSDDQAEADAICDAVLDAYENGVPLVEQAVVFRAAAHSAVLELELHGSNIPFVKYGGLKFVEAATGRSRRTVRESRSPASAYGPRLARH